MKKLAQRPLIALGLYAVGVVVLGCLLTPPLYWGGQALAEAGVQGLAKFPLQRFFDRGILIAAIALGWPLYRAVGVRRWTELGLEPNAERRKHLIWGLFLGAGGLWIVAQAMIMVGRAKILLTWHYDRVAGAVLTAVVVALIEETLFRGFFLGILRRHLRTGVAVLVLTALFAVLHFCKPPWHYHYPGPVTWTSGFGLLPVITWQFGSPRLLVGGFLTLFFVGLTLAIAAVRTRSLYLGIGLHAGWVFALRSFDILTKYLGKPSFWLGKSPFVGLAPVGLGLVTLGLVVWLTGHWRRPPVAPEVPLGREITT